MAPPLSNKTSTISALQPIPFSTLIGGPMDALIQAQAQAALTSYEFIRKIGLTENPKAPQAVNVTFQYQSDGKTVNLIVPLLTLVPVPYIQIDQADIEFLAKISAAQSTSTGVNIHTDSDGNLLEVAEAHSDTSFVQSDFKANYSSQQDVGYQNESRYSVEYNVNMKVSARQSSMPAGFQSILNILQESIQHQPVDTLTLSPLTDTLQSPSSTSISFQARLVDTDGQPMPNQQIEFLLEPAPSIPLNLAITQGDSVGDAQQATATGTSTEQGIVELTLSCDSTASITDTQRILISAKHSEENATAFATLQLIPEATNPPSSPPQTDPVPPTLSMDLEPVQITFQNPHSTSADSPPFSQSDTVVAHLTHANQNPQPNQQIYFSLTPEQGGVEIASAPVYGTLTGEQTHFSAYVITDDDGKSGISIGVTENDSMTTRTFQLTASNEDGSLQKTTEIIVTPPSENLQPPLLSNDVLFLDCLEENATNSLQVTIKSSEGNPVSNQMVTFTIDTTPDASIGLSITQGSLLNHPNPNVIEGITDENGHVELTLTVTDSTLSSQTDLNLQIEVSGLTSSSTVVLFPNQLPRITLDTPSEVTMIADNEYRYDGTVLDSQGSPPYPAIKVHHEVDEGGSEFLGVQYRGETFATKPDGAFTAYITCQNQGSGTYTLRTSIDNKELELPMRITGIQP
ncbi:MAG: DUF2589 domain-containing protein [Verrucomicrobiota bacterium]